MKQALTSLSKARYVYATWTLAPDKMKSRHIEDMVTWFHDAAAEYSKKWHMEDPRIAALCYHMALKISRSEKLQRPLDYGSILSKICTVIGRIHRKKRMDQPLMALLKVATQTLHEIKPGSVERNWYQVNQSVQRLLRICQQTSMSLSTQKDYRWQRRYLNQILLLSRFLEDDDIRQATISQIAQSYQIEGLYHPSKVVEAELTAHALAIYKDLKLRKQSAELSLKIQEDYQTAFSNKEFTKEKMVYSVADIADIRFDDILGGTSYDILDRVIKDELLLPDHGRIRATVEWDRKDNPSLYSSPMELSLDNGIIKRITNQREIFNRRYMDRYLIELPFWEEVIAKVIDYLLEKELAQYEVISYIRKSGMVRKGLLTESVIRAHMRKDYISSVHILLPLISKLLKKHIQLDKRSKKTPKKKPSKKKELTITEMIRLASPQLNDKLKFYLRARLTPEGVNTALKIQEGRLPRDEFTRALSSSLLYTILLLTQEKAR
jgi:ribosomal protein L11